MSSEILTPENALPQAREIPKVHIERVAKNLIHDFKLLFETKFPLFPQTRMGTQTQMNEILTDDFGIFNILYLPFDENRKDKEEQVKVSSDKEKVTVIIKNDKENSEISFELFELNDSMPERKIASETNNLEAIYRANEMLKLLSGLTKFDLVYTTLDL